MVIIEKINWLSKEAKEAEVFLSDGNLDIIVFGHPFHHRVGDKIVRPLRSLDAREIYKINDEEGYSVKRQNNTFEYQLKGQILDKNKNQVKVGEFIIETDIPLPADIQDEDYVSFVCARIDVY